MMSLESKAIRRERIAKRATLRVEPVHIPALASKHVSRRCQHCKEVTGTAHPKCRGTDCTHEKTTCVGCCGVYFEKYKS